jgi:hypothetical protein
MPTLLVCLLYMYYSNLKILTPSKYFENGGVQTIFIARHSTTVQYRSYRPRDLKFQKYSMPSCDILGYQEQHFMTQEPGLLVQVIETKGFGQQRVTSHIKCDFLVQGQIFAPRQIKAGEPQGFCCPLHCTICTDFMRLKPQVHTLPALHTSI